MSKMLKEKTAVITGGATGIGFEIADQFLQNGAKKVILLDINENLGKEAVIRLNKRYGDNKALFYSCDVTVDLDVIYQKIVSNFKVVDILVNNAGVLNELNIKKTIDVNVKSLIEWSLRFLEHMRLDKSGRGGTIVNLASIYGYRHDQYLPVYNASKFAVIGFTKSLGHVENFRKFGVRVVAVCPGFTSTELTSEIKTRFSERDEELAMYSKEQLWQNADVVGKATVDVIKIADSGTAWLIEGAKPISQVE